MGVDLFIEDANHKNHIFQMCSQATYRDEWRKIAKEHEFEYFMRFVPLELDKPYLGAVISEAEILKNVYLEICRGCSEESYENELARSNIWFGELVNLTTRTDWVSASIG